jgi:hypothetical protein
MTQFAFMFFQDTTSTPSAAGGAAAMAMMVLWLAIVVVEIAAMWRVFTKAGYPGWAAIVPIYNAVVMCKIGGKPGWWFLILWLVIPWFMVSIGIARAFGKGTGFGIGLALLFPIFVLPLAWGDTKHQLQPAAA